MKKIIILKKVLLKKLKQDKKKLIKRLWGDNYYNPKEKKWSTKKDCHL